MINGSIAVMLLAHLEFGVSVNPIPARGADYAHRITACPPGFENLTTSLHKTDSISSSSYSENQQLIRNTKKVMNNTFESYIL